MHEPPPPLAESPIPVARPLLVEPGGRPWFGSDLYLTEISRRDAWLDTLLLLVVPIGMVFGVSIVLVLNQAGEESTEIRKIDIGMAIVKWVEFALVAFLAVYFIFRHRVRPESFGIRFNALGPQLLWAVATFVIAYAYLFISGVIVVTILALFAPEFAEREMVQRQQLFRAIDPEQPMLLSFAIVLAVGFHEELLFRGLLLTHLRRATGGWAAAIVLSSLIFGVLHFVQGWVAVIQVTGLSILLSLIFIASRSLLAVAIAHAAFDFCQFQLIRLLPRILDWLREHGIEVPAPPA